MRGLVRRRTQEDEEESVFVTMTDMTISFLLIVMILLAFFATQINDPDMIKKEEYDNVLKDLQEAQEERDRISELNTDLLFWIRVFAAEVERLKVDLADATARLDELIEKLAQLQKINPLEAYLAEAARQRNEILTALETGILERYPALEGALSIQQDTLRFQGEGLFDRRESSLRSATERGIVETMGTLLDELLVCYTFTNASQGRRYCDSNVALVESVQIEGHTDSDGGDEVNFPLSAARAFTTLATMVRVAPGLRGRLNFSDQPVLSIAGYGATRPIEPNETEEGKAANRRIDLRIIMYAPSTVEEVEEIGRRLDALRDVGGAE